MFTKSGAAMETDAHPRALLNMSFRVPSKGALPLGPPHGITQVTEILIPATQGFMAYTSLPFQSD
jgi:hypothetical protein